LEKHQIKLPLFSFELLKDNPVWKWEEQLTSLRDGKIENFAISEQFKGNLFPYQKDAVVWLMCLHHYELGGILADEMGLGKTVQVLAFLASIKTTLPHLIIMPTSILFQWVKEKERFLPTFSHLLYSGEKRERDLDNLQRANIIFTSYGIFYRDIELFSKLSFECLILDEAQKIKNPESKTFAAIQKIKSRARFALTGTPLENTSLDLWTLFEFVMPGFLRANTIQHERKKVAPFLLRRLKKSVCLDLPPKMESIQYVSMSFQQKTLYEQFKSDFQNTLLQKEVGYIEVFEALLRLRQICCHPCLFNHSLEHSLEGKFELLINDIEQLTMENHKILVYSQFTQMLALIRKEIELRKIPYVYLDGNTKDRKTPVEAFQHDPSISLFLISLKAGGVGLDLSQADYVLIYDPWWNEAVENQAIDRAHRIGRKTPLFVKRYVTLDSIEEKMLTLKEKKKDLIQAILQDEAKAFSSFSLNELINLL
jgi:SNF2 family DNA or RNA helicase